LSAKFQLLLVGNYAPDRQISMLRFADMMLGAIGAQGVRVEMIQPQIRLGRWAKGRGEAAKWLGYMDKFLLFPRVLRSRINAIRGEAHEPLIVHICDHSNAMFVRALDGAGHLLTCHDLMAVQLARGLLPGPRVRATGRQLQRLICGGLERARRIVCVSENTRRDLHKVCRLDRVETSVIHNQLNFPFRRMPARAAREAVGALIPSNDRPLVLHVGNNSWYKNRDGVLRIFQSARRKAGLAHPRLVIVGHEMSAVQKEFLAANGMTDDVTWVPSPETVVVQAFYSLASVFLFPSLYEGFGWPPLEAQACGCPVVASTGGGLAEVLEDSALLAAPDEEEILAGHVADLLAQPALREKMIAKGTRNVERFQPPCMIDAYMNLYGAIAGRPGKGGE
jgi:glycosyltransferase involved in cell wall biosynthesis